MEEVSGESAPRHPTSHFCWLLFILLSVFGKNRREGSEALVPSLAR